MGHGAAVDRLVDQVRAAAAAGTPLAIRGGDTKAFLGRPVAGTRVDTREHNGIVHYDPNELVITACAGTPLVDIEATLAERGQMLACEAPHFSAGTTFGGMVASGVSGPRRPWSGAVRDFVLGCRIIDSRASHVRFGGEVMKNVAGYDLSRAMAGSFGCLGLLTEVSMKVLPVPPYRVSLRIELDVQQSLTQLAHWAREPLPISAACHDGGALMLRLEGGHGSVKATAARLGGSRMDDGFWQQLRDHQLPFFAGTRPLWRLGLPTNKQLPKNLPGEVLIDWAGAQCWLRSDAPVQQIREIATAAGGHAALWRGDSDMPFPPLPPALFALHRRLKAQLDPRGLFNPGRMYAGL